MLSYLLVSLALLTTGTAAIACVQAFKSLKDLGDCKVALSIVKEANINMTAEFTKLQGQLKREKEARVVSQNLYRDLVRRVGSGDTVISIEHELQTLRDLSNNNGNKDS